MEKSDGQPMQGYREKKQWRRHRPRHSDSSDDGYHFKRCLTCSNKIRSEQYHKHKEHCYSLKECKYCHEEWPQTHHYDHQVLCRKNPVAKAMRRKYPSSSDPSDSSDQDQWVYQDGYYRKKIKKQNKAYYTSSQEQQQKPQYTVTQQQQKPPQAEIKQQSFFHHRPRRQYRLSQSSSQEDQRSKYWRNFHEEFSVIPTNFEVNVFKTDLEGIQISESRDGRSGRVIRRTVHNNLTGKFEIISNHRFERHYRSHVIDYQRQNQEGQNADLSHTLVISNRISNSNQYISQPYGLTAEQYRNLKRHQYKRGEEEQKCAICYTEYEEEEKVIELKCKHIYHEDCGDKWLKQNPHCPLCKSKQN